MQQLNQAYAVLLAAHFQGFCRDLHSEAVDHILAVMGPPAPLRNYLRLEMTRGRQVDRGNAQPSSSGADFGRFGVKFWEDLKSYDLSPDLWRSDLDELNEWRNAIVHQDFTSPRLSGLIELRRGHVRRWRSTCRHLARSMDELIRQHLAVLTGALPW
jgi:hypothetical protein